MIKKLNLKKDLNLLTIAKKINAIIDAVEANSNHMHSEHIVYGPLQPIGPGTVQPVKLEMSDEMKKSYDDAIKNPLTLEILKSLNSNFLEKE